MPKNAATNLLGSDYSVAAARMDADGRAMSVLKYQEKKKQNFFLYFRNDKLTFKLDPSQMTAAEQKAAAEAVKKATD